MKHKDGNSGLEMKEIWNGYLGGWSWFDQNQILPSLY